MADQLAIPFLEESDTDSVGAVATDVDAEIAEIDDFDPSKYKDLEELLRIDPEKDQIMAWYKYSLSENRKEVKARKELYYAAKAKILALEEKSKKNGTQRLYVAETENHFFKLFGASAMIYAFDICDQLKKRTPALHTDKDEMFQGKDVVSKDIVVIFKDLATFRKDLKQLGIKGVYRKEAFSEFLMPEKYTPERIAEMRQTDERRWKEVNEMILPSTIFPAFYQALRETEGVVFQVARNCNPFERELFGDDMLATMGELIREYIKMANNWEGMKPKEFQAFGLESIHHLRTDVVIVGMRRPVASRVAKRLERKLEVLEGKLINAKI